MQKVEAPTLEEAYTRAARALDCSVTELEVTVVQNPNRGFLGLFARPAVIVAMAPGENPPSAPAEQALSKPVAPSGESEPEATTLAPDRPAAGRERVRHERSHHKPPRSTSRADRLVADFNEPSADSCEVCQEIEAQLNALFANTCYRIDPIKVTMHDEKTVRVFFDGEDAALLIGKDGYRYKALSYILFNWINPKYGYLLRLEIAEFLQNQPLSGAGD